MFCVCVKKHLRLSKLLIQCSRILILTHFLLILEMVTNIKGIFFRQVQCPQKKILFESTPSFDQIAFVLKTSCLCKNILDLEDKNISFYYSVTRKLNRILPNFLKKWPNSTKISTPKLN